MNGSITSNKIITMDELIKIFCKNGFKISIKNDSIKNNSINIPKCFLNKYPYNDRLCDKYDFTIHSFFDPTIRINLTSRFVKYWAFQFPYCSWYSMDGDTDINFVMEQAGCAQDIRFIFDNYLLPSIPNLSAILLLTSSNLLLHDIWNFIIKLILKLDHWHSIILWIDY